jgi:hypothetical protein
MHRRTVLAAAATLLAGCTGDSADGSSTIRTTGEATTTGTTTTQTGRAATTEATETATPRTTDAPADHALVPADPASRTAAEVRDRLRVAHCDRLADATVVCPDDSAKLTVSLSKQVGSLPRSEISIIIRNDADEEFSWGSYSWTLSKYDGKQWRYIAPLAVPANLDSLAPTESHSYRVIVDNTAFYGTESYMTDDELTLSGLGPGVYAFTVDGYFESTADTKVVTAAPFGFASEGPAVRPTDAVAKIDREDSTLRRSRARSERGRPKASVCRFAHRWYARCDAPA